MTKKTLTRRHFLQSAGTAAAAPFLLPSSVWSAAVKPNDRITIGSIGMGKQNRGLTGNVLRRDGAEVVAVCDVDRNRRMAAAQAVNEAYANKADRPMWRGCASYNDFRDLVARRDLDAVIIATPDHWHAMTTIAAAQSGKDIYCEKPLCQSINEARAMVDAVNNNRRIFQTGSMQRSMREFRRAAELARNGVLGKITRIDVAVGGPPIWCDLPTEADEAGLDWNLWLGPSPWRPYNSELSPRGTHDHFPNWRKYREYGGGAVTDWGAHHFDIAQWVLGMDDSGPVEILPAKDLFATHGVRLRYPNGTEVVHTSGNGVTIHGTEGKVYVNRGRFRPEPESLEEFRLGQGTIRLYASSDHIGDWLNSMRTRVQPICPVEVGAHTVTVCHLVNLAYFHHQKMLWDPFRWSFVDDSGSADWLNVPFKYRSPWTLKA